MRRKPVRQIENDAREETCFRSAKKKSRGVKRRRAPHEHRRRRDQAPGDHDPGDPDARADARQDDVARDLEGDVAEKEDAGAEAERAAGKSQRGVHLERREPDVDAIEIRDDVEQEKKRDQPPADLVEGRSANLISHE